MNSAIASLRDAQIEALNQTLEDETLSQDLGEAVQHAFDLEKISNEVASRSEYQLYALSLKELNHSLLLALGSHYRQSFASQRLALELWFAGIHFSTNDFNLSKWKLSERDINWKSLINDSDGILSVNFAHVYWPAGEKRIDFYRKLSEKIYRECSEYVHGNSHTHSNLPTEFGYSRSGIVEWKNNMDTLAILFCYTFVLRYNREWEPSSHERISAIAIDKIGHLDEIRKLFST